VSESVAPRATRAVVYFREQLDKRQPITLTELIYLEVLQGTGAENNNECVSRLIANCQVFLIDSRLPNR